MKKAYTYANLSVMLVLSMSLAAQDTESDLLDVEFSLNQWIIDTKLEYLLILSKRICLLTDMFIPRAPACRLFP